MSQHTPGEWKACFPVGNQPFVGNQSTVIAKDIGPRRDMDEAQANARIIAAAPELLVALTESLRWIAKVAADHDDDPHLSGQALKMHDKTRAAICKAQEG